MSGWQWGVIARLKRERGESKRMETEEQRQARVARMHLERTEKYLREKAERKVSEEQLRAEGWVPVKQEPTLAEQTAELRARVDKLERLLERLVDELVVWQGNDLKVVEILEKLARKSS